MVTAAEQASLDLLLTAARRRMPGSTFEFPKRLTTRRNGPADAEICVSRNLFREIEQDDGFITTWQADGHRFGLPATLHELLIAGTSVVITAPADAVRVLNTACRDVRIVRLIGQLEAARAPLSPQACLRRIVGRRLAERLEEGEAATRIEAVSYGGDLPSAVRTLSEALVRIEQEHRQPRGRRAGVPSRARTGRYRRSSAIPALL